MISLKKGLAFQCQQCSYCCRFEPGFVFLTPSDIIRMSSFFKITAEEFLREHCREVNSSEGCLVSLKEKENHDCMYWDKGCTVYEARPVQCRTYPFWTSVLKNKESWEKESTYCPGIGKGPLLSEEEIRKPMNLREEPLFSCGDTVE